ncbi:MAG: flagellar hook-basal body complex protein FliE [Ancrocorticia sp.]|jgi:flagellar hook-basal body complex protein FliE|nr:flagellar hook-basal body complex protein FliE [Ancrocorticia sp.]MCI2178352.1 flagellar hook-basal body complex protein FliE [Ancrocorticia sp.]MCI2193158.1 flagellar hook-basal body complex protein FliE [Ancrocorticia sp.]MCI2198842.1 flagellar hook-basal body complex protein FliE [Ancrocorticia sp.]
MAIAAVEGVTGVLGTQYTAASGDRSASASDVQDFASALAGAVDGVSERQETTLELGVQAVTGELTDVHDYTVAAAESAVALELMVAIRNQAIGALNEILRIQA